ncbi:MAG: ATP-binding cassette domain-containing protein [Synergistaceae bacterium]|jgi:ATPase subunit of ABC transporter with duplicated ATPase domains|nr:ATP-binding cassette domain-containing protein [Synergistaceae bacterium]
MPVLTLHNLTYFLPDGRLLLNNLSESFGGGRTALTGRNGTGKTVLAKIMAGLLPVVPPSSGGVTRDGTVFYLDQTADPAKFGTVAALMGAEEILNAVRRAESSSGSEDDLALADGHWDTERRIALELRAAGLGYLTPDTPAPLLSGGECTRALLAGAFLSGADFLILDEPTNHLDARSREALTAHLEARSGSSSDGGEKRAPGLLVISHDRALLERMERIVELSPQGLRSYGGGFSLYREWKETEHAAALEHLDSVKTERRRAAAEARASIERQEHRSAQGRKGKPKKGFPKAVLHSMKATAEKTAGKLTALKEEKAASLALAEKEAFLKAGIEDPVVLIPPACSVHAAKVILRLEGVVLPYGSHRDAIDWVLTGPERAAVEGPNGSGKTTLLRILTGAISPLAGRCEVKVPYAVLDQFAAFSPGPPNRPAVELLRESSGGTLSLAEAGTRLAQIGIARERLLLPAEVLSGGERLKAALLCALHRSPPPQLLILDEPTNHLDLDSTESVEKVLNAYTGAILVVSHDSFFLNRAGVSRRLCLGSSERAGISAEDRA